MKPIKIPNNVSRAFHKVGFQLKKHSPEILVVSGVVGVVASAVLACKATLKVNEVLEKTKTDVNNVHACLEDKSMAAVYTPEDGKKDLAKIYVNTGLQFAKLYGPAVGLGALSVISILGGHNILRKRNVALAAAYATVDGSFKDYRKRVIERFGKELDHELKYNIKAKEVEEVVTDKDGSEKVVKKTVQVADVNTTSEYAKFFDEYCPGWCKDAELNRSFLQMQQNYANDLLKSQGYLFLNDVYYCLGIPKTQAGQVVGWVYDPNNPDHDGDNFVDFGIFDVHDKQKRAFVNGYERSILLDFNVDGYILDKI